MWLWQQKNRPRWQFYRQVVLVVCAVHVVSIVLLLLLDGLERRLLRVHTQMHYTQADVVVLPFCKYVAPAKQKAAAPAKKVVQKKATTLKQPAPPKPKKVAPKKKP